MMFNQLNRVSRPVSCLLFSMVLAMTGQCQDSVRAAGTHSSDIPQVKWVKQWPGPDKKQHSNRFKARFNAIFLGKKAPVLTRPVAVLASSEDHFWVLDQGIRSMFSIQGEVGDIPHFVKKADLDFSSLVGICEGPAGTSFITDSHAKKVYRLLAEKKKISILNDSVKLDQPTGVAYSKQADELWVVETNAHRIAVLDENGKLIRHIGSRGTAEGEFNYPTHIWIGRNNLVYVVDAMNFRVQVLTQAGKVVSVFGQPGDASGYFARPKGIATDSHGNIYVADALFHVVQVFDLKGNFLYKIGSQGQEPGAFWMPSGIYIDALDFIYVADTYNARVQVFQLVYATKK
jgi:DNA-binding beta-propeller fold protein YncE